MAAIVRGQFTDIIQPGLRDIFYAGMSFTQAPNGLWTPQQFQPPTLLQAIYGKFSLGYLPIDYRSPPRPNEFETWEDYLVSRAEWEYGFRE